MAEELKESGTVTAMSVVGFVFGLIGMMGSFIPCLGSLAFYVGIPAAIISGIAVGIAYSQNTKRTFAIAALTISLIGVVISGWQYFSIISAGNKAKAEIDQWLKPGSGVQANKQTNNLPAFEITDAVSGKKLNSSLFKEKVLLINFWASWAVPATNTSPFIERIYKEKSNDDNFLILTILHKDNVQDALNFIKSKGFTFPVYVSSGNNVSQIFGVTGVPETILIDRNGQVKKKNIGELLETDATNWLQEIKNLELI